MTSTTKDLALLAARVLLGVLFVMAGIGKLGNVEGFAGYMASGGVPAFLAWPVILFEILGGAAIIAGIRTAPVAIVLAAFTVLAGALYHYVPADQMQMTQFLKNLAIAGGFLAIGASGAGRFSVDGWSGARTVAA